MKINSSPEFSSCSLAQQNSANERYDLYAPTPQEKRAYYHDLREEDLFIKGQDVPREQAQLAYAELRTWNGKNHNRMVEVLEPVFLDHIERALNFVILHPHEIKRMSETIPTYQIPYRFAGLPPNLFDHLDSKQPFLPQTKQSVLDLINGLQTHTERLKRSQSWDVISNGKEDIYYDVGLELLRKQQTQPGLFSTEADQEAWHRYSQSFKQTGPENKRPTFHQSVIAVNYLHNRQYSEASGFFEKTDGMFDAFLLANFQPSRHAVTSQIRIPFLYGSEDPATELLQSAHVLMQLLKSDQQLSDEVQPLALRHPFLEAYLTRSQGLEIAPNQLHHGLYDSLIESVAVIAALFAECEADGIPGFENDLWGGLQAMLEDDVPVKIAANVPPAVIMPPTLHGNRFTKMLVQGKHGLRQHPAVAEKIQQMHDRQTIMLHQRWREYQQNSNQGKPPVRFGLHCPFKNNVVRQMAEALIMCRAAIHA